MVTIILRHPGERVPKDAIVIRIAGDYILGEPHRIRQLSGFQHFAMSIIAGFNAALCERERRAACCGPSMNASIDQDLPQYLYSGAALS